jgi:hypothetical protein
MQKTILHWLHELPTEYVAAAIKNHLDKPYMPSEFLCDSIADALGNAFDWNRSSEGKDYWFAAHSSIAGGERPLVEPIPPKPFIAKIACPELDRELMENPPSGETWISALSDYWRPKFAEAYEAYKNKIGEDCGVYFDHFGYLVDTLKKAEMLPKSYQAHAMYSFRSHNVKYLLHYRIMDELALASIIGTTPERAAELNGAKTIGEQKYYNDMKNTFTAGNVEMPANALENFVKAPNGELIPKSLLAGKPEPEFTLDARKPSDPVNHPKHYTKGDVECIDALAAATIDLTGMEAVCTANAIKYLWRWKHKNGVEDLNKARFYIDKLINELQK